MKVEPTYRSQDAQNDDELKDQQDIAEEENPTITQGKVPMKGDKILYQLPEAEDWLAATVICRVGKATGKNKRWINVQDSKDKAIRSANLEEPKAWKYVEEEVLLCTTAYGKNVLEAKIRNFRIGKTMMFSLKLQMMVKREKQFVGS